MSPSGKVAKATHVGSYDKLYEAWKTFDDIIKEQGLVPKGNTLWEVYTLGPEKDTYPENWSTDLFRPIE